MSDFFLIHQDPLFRQTVSQAVEGKGNFKVLGQATSASDALAKLGACKNAVVFVQLALPDTDGFTLIGQIQKKFPGCYPVPVLQGGEGGEVWQKILHMELKDVLMPPFSPPSLLKVCQDAANNAQKKAVEVADSGGGHPSYLVTVASARGGVGKSTLATNLAVSMARYKAQTLLVDLSMNAGDCFTMLDQVTRHTMVDAISQGMGLDGGLLKNLVADHNLGFQFLACPNEDFDFYSFDLEQAKNLLKIAREISEYVIVDTGAYDLPPTIAAVEESDLVYLVTNRDLARLMALQRLIKSLVGRGVDPEKLKIIVNNSEVGTEISEAEIEDVLGHQVTAYLPSVPAETVFSINSGKPISQTQSDHPVSAVIGKLAEYTVERWAEPAG